MTKLECENVAAIKRNRHTISLHLKPWIGHWKGGFATEFPFHNILQYDLKTKSQQFQFNPIQLYLVLFSVEAEKY